MSAATPPFGHAVIASPPHFPSQIEMVLRSVGDVVMGTIQDHRKYAEQCVAMARLSEDDSDKALWLTLAQSWVQLAEHVARAEADLTRAADDAAESDDVQASA